MVLRELLVKLGLDVDAQSFAKGHLAADAIEKSLEKIVQVAEKVFAAFESAIEAGNKIKKTAQSIGIATDALQQLQYAGSLADLSAEEMSQSIGILSRNMLHAKQGSEEAAKAFKGIKFQENGKLIATEEVLGNIAEKFKSMPDGAEKTGMAMQLFGRAGKQMIPLLNKGRDGLEEMRKEAEELGLVLDKEAIEASEELNDSLIRLKAVTHGLLNQAIGPLLPAISELVKKILEWKKENSGIIKQKLHDIVSKIGRALRFLSENFGAIKFAVMALTVALLVLKAEAIGAAIVTAASWALAVLPFLAITAAITSLFLLLDDFRGYMEGDDSLFGDFVNAIGDWMKPRATDPWFVTALKDFVRWITKAVELVEELDEVFGDGSKRRALLDQRAGKNAGQQQMDTDRFTLQSARTRAGQGLPLTEDEKAALARSGVSENAFLGKYGSPGLSSPALRGGTPELRQPMPASSGGGAPVVNVNAPIGPVTQAPGESGEGFAKRVSELIQQGIGAQLEGAVAGIVR